jgi:VWFA-related protein
MKRLLIVCTLALAAWPLGATQERPAGRGFSFKTGVELINVTTTVTDGNGRFVSGLRREDFVLYEDGKPQVISQFDSERVPVSLGVALDTSGSMTGDKILAARAAVNRFLLDLLGPQDEVFLYRFDSRPDLVQPWTTDRQALSRAIASVKAGGGTAMYDTVAESIPLAQAGSRQKKALVVISDGNDTNSRTQLPELRHLIRETEVLVYAIGIDASGIEPTRRDAQAGALYVQQQQPVPSPFPGRKPTQPARPAAPPPPVPAQRPAPAQQQVRSGSGAVNVDALRQMTDESGGRTEVIYSSRDLDPATAGIADELSKQYFLGYVSSLPKDGKWHTIEVQVRRGNYIVRARKGFVAN